MSGRIANFYGKRQPVTKAAGVKPSSPRNQVLAARQRKKSRIEAREAEKARKAELAEVGVRTTRGPIANKPTDADKR